MPNPVSSQVTNYTQANNSFFADMLQHDDFLERYEHLLKGEVLCYVKDTGAARGYKEMWVKRYPAKMNPYGVNEIISALKPICESRIIALTDFKEQDIKDMIFDNSQRIASLLFINKDIFEINSAVTIQSIYTDCENLIKAQIKRSFEGETLHRITQNTNINETRDVSTFKEENSSLISKVPFLSKIKI
jgi:hypothetical protein